MLWSRRWWRLVILIAGVGLLYAGRAAAQASNLDNQLDAVVNNFRNASAHWTGALHGFANQLFWILVSIEVTWSAMALALKGADLSEWLAELVNRVLYIGFFKWLLDNSGNWTSAIINSFRQAANAASQSGGGGSNISPSNIFDGGVKLATRVTEKLSWSHPADSTLLAVGAVVVLLAFALITAFMIVTLVEAYVVTSAGVILLGFGGSRWTKEYALKVIQYTMSVGAKLFVLQLIVGLGETMVQQWISQFGNMDVAQMFVLIGSAVVVLALTKMVPEIVQALVMGTHMSGGGGLVGALGAVAGGAAAVAATVSGSGAVAASAYRLAREQVAASGGGGGLSVAAQTVRNLAGSAASDVGARLSGRSHHGHMAWRMSERMGEQAEVLRQQREGPPAASGLPAPTAASVPLASAGNVIRATQGNAIEQGSRKGEGR